jgi:cell division protein FtsZ
MLEAFAIADDILRQGVQCITDLIVKNMVINVDFADVSAIMRNSGLAHMGIGEAEGDNRLLRAIQQAIHSPILETSIKNASQIIMSVMGGEDLLIHEVNNYATLVMDVLDPNCNIIFGADLVPELAGKVKIVIIATGFAGAPVPVDITRPNPVQAPKIIEKDIIPHAKPATDDENLPPYIRKMREK